MRVFVLWVAWCFRPQLASALSISFKEDNGTGGRDIERAYTASHGDAKEVITGSAHKLMKTFSFATHHQGTVAREIEPIVVHCAAFV